MKSVKTKSTHSVRSIKSLKSVKSLVDEDVTPHVMDFEDYIVMATQKFVPPYPVIVKKLNQSDIFFKTTKRSSSKSKKTDAVLNGAPHSDSDFKFGSLHSTSVHSTASVAIYDITINAVYDNLNHLVEIGIEGVRDLPRMLMQIIGLIVPLFNSLAKITLKQCNLDPYLIHELNKILSSSSVTDMCFDGSPMSEICTALDTRRLSNLSLSRCGINDEDCRTLALNLHCSGSSELSVRTLDLSSNEITDIGAKLFAAALRTNRHLRYLNLADNRIADEGALCIFDSLKDFSLTCDEIMDKRRRHIDYLRTKRALFLRYFNEFDIKSADEFSQASKKSTTKKRKTSAMSLKGKGSARREKDKIRKSSFSDDDISGKAEMLVNEIMGPFNDPYDSNSTKVKNGHTFCKGNMVLSYLNLSYNNLSYLSLKKVHKVLNYQIFNKRPNQLGLIKILLDGNMLPISCAEWTEINEVLSKNIVSCFGGRLFSEFGRRKSRTARVSMVTRKE